MITTQFEFVPNCIVLPADRDVTLRFTSPDVIHGLLVTGTNVNTMVVPGYVAQVHTRFTKTGDLLMPCHEYCGLGHSPDGRDGEGRAAASNSGRMRKGGQPVATIAEPVPRRAAPGAPAGRSAASCRRAGW